MARTFKSFFGDFKYPRDLPDGILKEDGNINVRHPLSGILADFMKEFARVQLALAPCDRAKQMPSFIDWVNAQRSCDINWDILHTKEYWRNYRRRGNPARAEAELWVREEIERALNNG